MSDHWWEKQIPRLQVIIKGLESDRARATYGPAIRGINDQLAKYQYELNNALRAREAHLNKDAPASEPVKSGAERAKSFSPAFLETAQARPPAPSETAEDISRSYAKRRTKTLQRELKEIKAKLHNLGEEFPDWQIRAGYSGQHPDDVYREGRRLERAREEISLELSKRGVLKTRTDSGEAERKPMSAAGSGFTYHQDYSSVTLHGRTYALTSRQAQVIQILHEAYKNRRPDVRIDSILEELGTENSRWQDTFRTNPKAREALITSGARKGTLRLNL